LLTKKLQAKKGAKLGISFSISSNQYNANSQEMAKPIEKIFKQTSQ
jgi:hypothetical protein